MMKLSIARAQLRQLPLHHRGAALSTATNLDPHDESGLWMPFTANRNFHKDKPRVVKSGKVLALSSHLFPPFLSLLDVTFSIGLLH
jgi:hypothetical protein